MTWDLVCPARILLARTLTTYFVEFLIHWLVWGISFVWLRGRFSWPSTRSLARPRLRKLR